MITLDDTIAFIKQCHAGQITKIGEPYWTHPVAVMRSLPENASDDAKHAALLHDVVDDCGVTAADLLQRGYSPRTVHLVVCLSRPTGMRRPSYMDWIRSIGESGDRELIEIKLADNWHNSLPERIASLPEDERNIVRRYERSTRVLQKALGLVGGTGIEPVTSRV